MTLTKKQLRQRVGRIGASECGTALGYFGTKAASTPFQFVIRKCRDLLPTEFVHTHQVIDTRPHTPLLRGTMMENSVMRLLKSRHKNWYIRRIPGNQTLEHTEKEWEVATPDGVIIDENGLLWVAEYKTMSIHRFKNLAEELVELDDDINVIKKQVRVSLPISIQMQGAQTLNVVRSIIDSGQYHGSALHQALINRLGDRIPQIGGVVFFYVLIGNGEVYYDDPIEIKWVYDEAGKTFMQALEAELDEFWEKYMKSPDPETLLSLRNATDYAGIMEVASKIVDVPEFMEFDGEEQPVVQVVEKIKTYKADIKEAEGKVAHLEGMVKEWIGENEGIEFEGRTLATWKRQNAGWTLSGENAKRILKEHPEYEGLIKQTSFRRLNLK